MADSILLVCPRATTKLIRQEEATAGSLEAAAGDSSTTIFISNSNNLATGEREGMRTMNRINYRLSGDFIILLN